MVQLSKDARYFLTKTERFVVNDNQDTVVVKVVAVKRVERLAKNPKSAHKKRQEIDC